MKIQQNVIHCLVLSIILLSIACTSSNKPMNVIVITIDTLRSDVLGCYGNPRVHSPTLDKLARRSVSFQDAYVSIPITNPSHCSIFTGKYPFNHGALNFGYRLPADEVTIMKLLRDKGYATAAFVSGFSLVSRVSGLEKDFDLYDDQWSKKRRSTEQSADKTTSIALDWLGKNQEKHFGLWVHYFDPHKPYAPPQSYGQLYEHSYKEKKKSETPMLLKSVQEPVTPTAENDEKDEESPQAIQRNWNLYLGEVSFTDAQIARLMQFLAHNNLLKKTLIVVTSDHGESFEHGYLYRHIDRIYDSLLSVPLLLSSPRLKYPGVLDGQMPIIDIAPTLASFLKMQYPLCDGYSRYDELVTEKKLRLRGELYAQTPGRHAPWSRGDVISLREGFWKLLYYKDEASTEFFNTGDDPAELIDKSAEEPALRDSLFQKMQTWMTKQYKQQAAPMEMDQQDQENLKALGYLQ